MKNTYFFGGMANLDIDSPFGSFMLNQAYTSSTLDPVRGLFRDDERAKFEYRLPIAGLFSFIIKQNWLLSAENFNIGLKGLNRINGFSGISYSNSKLFSIEASGGMESLNQYGFKSNGAVFNFLGNINNYNLYDFNINSNYLYNYTKLENDRLHSDLNFTANINRKYDEKDYMDLAIGVSNTKNDDIYSFAYKPGNPLMIIRGKSDINALFNINFLIGSNLDAKIRLGYNNSSQKNHYNYALDSVPFTKIEKNIVDKGYSTTGELHYVSKYFIQNISISYDNTEKRFFVNPFDIISTSDLNTLKLQESKNDNTSGINKLSTETYFIPSSRDSIKINYLVSLLRYDSPSSDMNDDRDEYYTIAGLTYSRRFTDAFSANLNMNMEMQHKVYIKTEMSGENYWSRKITFSPSFSWKNKTFFINPTFFIFARYYVYDFEIINEGANNSTRELIYQDTILVNINSMTNIQSKLYYRYQIQGTLDWHNFSETPTGHMNEFFGKVMLFSEISKNIVLGSGFRYYQIEQLSLSRFFGPEAAINLRLSNGSGISLQGWIEFQKISSLKYKMVPNFTLQTNYSL